MKKKQQRDRELAVKRYLQGEEISAIAKSLGARGLGFTNGLSATRQAAQK